MWQILDRISIRSKFIAGFALAFLWTLGLGGFSVERLAAVERAAADLRDGSLQAAVALSRIGQTAGRLRSVEQVLVATAAEERRKTLLADREAQAQQVQAAFALYRPSVAAGEEQALAQTLAAAWAGYMTLGAQLVSMIGQVQPDIQIGLLNGRMLQVMNRFREALTSTIEFNMQEGRGAAARGAALGNAAQRWIGYALGTSLLMCLIGGWLMIVNVARPLGAMSASMQRLSRHETDAAVVGLGRRDELGAMAASVEQFRRGIIEADEAAAERSAEQAAKALRAETLEGLVRGF